jgi:hypothetical protein
MPRRQLTGCSSPQCAGSLQGCHHLRREAGLCMGHSGHMLVTTYHPCFLHSYMTWGRLKEHRWGHRATSREEWIMEGVHLPAVHRALHIVVVPPPPGTIPRLATSM